MYYYRAINTNDALNLKNGNNILSSKQNNFGMCTEKLGDSLDCIIGHLNGKAKNSPLISASRDFKIVAHEYSIPQNGNYNLYKRRKLVIMIDGNALNQEATKDYREYILDNNENYIFELCDKGSMKSLYDRDILKISTSDMRQFANLFWKLKEGKITHEEFVKKINEKPEFNCPGFENFANAVDEVVFLGHINRNSIKLVLNPFFVDLLYACDDLEFIYNLLHNPFKLLLLKEHILNLSSMELYIFKESYKTLDLNCDINMSGKQFDEAIEYTEECETLFNIACNILKNGDNDSIAYSINKMYFNQLPEMYEFLKEQKRILLSNILKSLDFDINPKDVKLVDDKVFVIYDYNSAQVKNSAINDVMIIQKGNEIITDANEIKAFFKSKKTKKFK